MLGGRERKREGDREADREREREREDYMTICLYIEISLE
jgi:hypothetical protein